MGESQPQTSFDALHGRPNSIRRARPPNIDLIQRENSIPLRAEKSTKRESKIGLRGIFARSKTEKIDEDAEESPSRITSRSSGIRASLVDFGTWPYRHSSRSEASLLSTRSVDTRSTPADLFSRSRPQQGGLGADKLRPAARLNGPVGTASWNPPPLFQVYPQAVKHGTLPACNISVEALTRYSETKTSKLTHGMRIRDSQQINDFNMKVKGDTLKKRQRITGFKNSWEWTSKIFVLVTSGYLCQYAAEGTFNRLPEKFLQLTATSAAYASDLIPGKHWVLQVASATDAEGNTFADPKSRLPKLSIKDNRRVSNMLLVFETPESMDDWLAILRREIEAHGGKRKASETGDLETEDSAPVVEAPLNQRPIVAKDHDRFSRVITRDFSYTQENSLVDPMDDDPAISQHRRISGHTMDFGSPTVSMVSSDGQRLENLRDSSSSHRFSYMSSGQRTMITSEGSSPACSPTRASFCSQGEDLQPLPNIPEVRLRPNAAAIVSRRQSMQALISSFEGPAEQASRPHVNSISKFGFESEHMNALSIPNFSVPHVANKRFSLNNPMPSSGLGHPIQMVDYDRNNKLSRKLPPTSLSISSRPLSIVIDQPSPRSPCSPNSLSRSVDSCWSADIESRTAAIALGGSSGENALSPIGPPKAASQKQPSQPSGIKHAASHSYGPIRPSRGFDSSITVNDVRTGEYISRAASSLGSYGARRKLSGPFPGENVSYKRSSLVSENGYIRSPPYSSADVDGKTTLVAHSACSPKRSAPSLRPSFAAEPQEKPVTARRSLPQLNDGLPPAPPPRHALPPIPQKPSTDNLI
ncbi:hypothetical protein F5Y14DRAFT_410959 [Nemania sp. NC0429]|nr:hypothetical protein F5Y14DRAFT_410959 [Nemania sp. NC0429]